MDDLDRTPPATKNDSVEKGLLKPVVASATDDTREQVEYVIPIGAPDFAIFPGARADNDLVGVKRGAIGTSRLDDLCLTTDVKSNPTSSDLEKVINDAGKRNEGGNTFVSQGDVWPINQGGDGRMNPFSSNN